jgi:hypothetical protein
VRLTLLHTSPVHVATFDALRDDLAPGVELVHLVREDLLADARTDGPEAVAERVATLVAAYDTVLCTCSTIGGVAERAGALRVDRPLARAAAAYDDALVVVLAALESTLRPTLDLLAEEGVRDASAVVVEGAWERFEAGDLDGYHRLVADEVERHRDAVVVLAQASMAPAAERSSHPRVLSSPRLGLAAALERAQASA